MSFASTRARTNLLNDLQLGLSRVKDLWDYEVKDWVTGVQAADIDLDGDIEVLAGSRDGRIYALTRDGESKWERVIGEKQGVTAIVAYPPDSRSSHRARIVVSNNKGKIYVLDSAGQEIPPTAHSSSPTHWYDVGREITQMVMDVSKALPLTVVFAADNFCVYNFDIIHNELRWRYPFKSEISSICSYDINGDGFAETLVGLNDQKLYLLSASGELLASLHMDQVIYSLFAFADKNGDAEILVGTRGKKLYALTPDLEEKWVQLLSSRPLAITAVDINNDDLSEILVACDDQSFLIFDAVGKPIWRQKLGKRYRSLSTCDLDLNGQYEILAGTDDSRVHALRIQLGKDLDAKIRRGYTALGRPDVTTLQEFDGPQLDLLLGILGITYDTLDKKLNLAYSKELIEKGSFSDALLSLLKLEHQKFQLLWEKDQIGYSGVLCLAAIAGSQRRAVVTGAAINDGLSVYNTRGRLLWDEASPGNQIRDVQSGYFSSGKSENLAFLTAKGSLTVLSFEKTRSAITIQIPEQISCFHLLAPGRHGSSEMLIGTVSGKVYRYARNFEEPRVFQLPEAIQSIYASDPDKSGPELLISTASNQLLAYTRGGRYLWTYRTRSPIKALCARDLDGDGRLEVLIGSEDRNIYVLDEHGNMRWRYVLYHTVLALETADLDGDGKQEILVGCGDSILYVFTWLGDLTWRYTTRDRIQALRIADIDQDRHPEISIVQENRLEVLRPFDQEELKKLIDLCWERLFAGKDPFDVLRQLIKGDVSLKGNHPLMRAAGLIKLTTLPLSPQTFDVLNSAKADAFTEVRRVLPEALMRAYPVDKVHIRQLLNVLFDDRVRDVRIEVLEHLELLADHDWSAVLSYLERALSSDERNTRRAALRKISHLLQKFIPRIHKDAQKTHGEDLFELLLKGAQDTVSTWVREEAGRVLADFFNFFENDFLFYLYRLFAMRLKSEVLTQFAYHLASPTTQQTARSLLALTFEFNPETAHNDLENATRALESDSRLSYTNRVGQWLICRELLALFDLQSIEQLATYEFRLTPEQFQKSDSYGFREETFLRIGDHVNRLIPLLKTYLRRNAPNDRLDSLTEGIHTLDTLQHVVDQAYDASPLPGAPQPPLPEFVVLIALIQRWRGFLHTQRTELRGHARLVYTLLSREVHFEEIVGIWLQIANEGRASARNIKITLLSNDNFTTFNRLSQSVEMNVLGGEQSTEAEFLIKPNSELITLTFEIAYEDVDREPRTTIHQEQLRLLRPVQHFTTILTPYTTGAPVPDSHMCYGRETDLDYLQGKLTLPTKTLMVLYGQRKAGKTTLLRQLAHTDRLAQHIPVMIDMQSLTYDFEVGKLFFKIAYEISREMHKKGLPVTQPHRKDFVSSFGAADPLFSFERFLDEVERFLSDRKLILLLDEFEALEILVKKERLQPEIFEYLRSLMQARSYIHFLLSGTHKIEELSRDYWSVFFNITQHYRLSNSISPEGAIALITEPVAGSLEYEPEVVKKIRLLTADQPYLIHLFCRSLVDHCNKMQKNYATLYDVNLIQKEVLDTGAIHFDWLWGRLNPQMRQLLQAIVEVCGGTRRWLELDEICAVYQQKQIDYQPDKLLVSLKTLWKEDIIKIDDEEQRGRFSDKTRFSLPNGLLSQWLLTETPLEEFLQETTSSQA